VEELKISLTARRKILVQMYYRYLLASSSLEYIKQDILDETQGQLDQPTVAIANDINEKLEDLIIIIEGFLTTD
jgi:N utilization substance protein B